MRIMTMAALGWRRLVRKAIPVGIVLSILSVPAAYVVSAVRAARRAAHVANTT
jgi:hypothetical protein